MPNKLFYVYEHWRPDRDECFYVGKGHGGRANQMKPRNAHHVAIQAKLARLGSCVEVRIVADGLAEAEAFALEIERIAFWRADGADLANMTDGGEGFTGGRLNKAAIDKIKSVHTGKVNSPETRAKMSASKLGHPVSKETKEKISRSKKGSKQSEAARIGLLKANTGRSPSSETRAKISAFHKGRKKTPETIAKIKAAKSFISEETRRKMSESQKKRFRKVKEA